MERTELGPAFLTRYKRACNRLPDIDDAYGQVALHKVEGVVKRQFSSGGTRAPLVRQHD